MNKALITCIRVRVFPFRSVYVTCAAHVSRRRCFAVLHNELCFCAPLIRRVGKLQTQRYHVQLLSQLMVHNSN